MMMHWPQMTMAGLMIFGLAATFVRERGFFVQLVSTAISGTLLYFGGFWG